MQIDMSKMSFEEVEAIRRQWLKIHKRTEPEPNTVFLPTPSSRPFMYYSRKRPTRALRFLCWCVGAVVDYLPDRQPKPIGTVTSVDGDTATVELNDEGKALRDLVRYRKEEPRPQDSPHEN